MWLFKMVLILLVMAYHWADKQEWGKGLLRP